MENSREIEKMFNQESSYKKMVGSNVHRMTGKGKRGGIKGGIRFAKNNFKKYEKNSKVKTNNIFESIIPYDQFVTYDEDTQYEMLYEWLLRFSKEKIKNGLGVSYNKLEKLFDTFNVDMERVIMRANSDEMKVFKEDDITISRFKSLPDDQKYEIVNYWNIERGMITKDIAKKLGYAENTLYTRKSVWKKAYKNMEGDNLMTDYADNFLLEDVGIKSNKDIAKTNEKEKELKTPNVVTKAASKDKKDIPVKETVNRIKVEEGIVNHLIKLQGVYSLDAIHEKFEAITNLLDENGKYEVSVTIKEYEE